MTACVRVIRPGMQTTVQDEGRWGFQSSGVPVAGAMDLFSHRLANALVGNPADSATLEVTFAGPELEFEDQRTVAIAGAEFALSVDDRPVMHGSALRVGSGSRLRFGARVRGARAYVGIAGGVDTTPVLGSRSTHVATRMGGFGGRPLAAGDRIPLGASSGPDGGLRLTPPAAVPPPRATDIVRVLPGPQHELFTADALDVLQAKPYMIGVDSGRMAYRLDGPPLRHRGTADIISDATPLGAVQVPGSGQPILLMADRQTTGGYAKIATVIAADIDLAAQFAPGESMSFRVCSEAEALAALIARERVLMAVERTAS